MRHNATIFRSRTDNINESWSFQNSFKFYDVSKFLNVIFRIFGGLCVTICSKKDKKNSNFMFVCTE